MKILFVPTSYPDETNPTRDVFIYEQAVALSKAGHDIRVLHAQKQPSKRILCQIEKSVKTVDDKYAIRFCLPVKTFVEDRFAHFNKTVFIKAMNVLYNAATLDGWKPDVLYSHFSCWAGYAAVELGRAHHIPVVAMEHFSGFMTDKPSSSIIDGLKYVVENADEMVCVSDNLRNSVIEKTGTRKNICVIPNMIDPSFEYVPHNLSDDFIFSTVCNLNERKRVKELVEAFCKAFTKKENVKLIIGGDGPEKDRIQECIRKNDRVDQIVLLGRLDRKGTVELYNKANCFVLASAHETFGIVWREAMATGLPVITSNHEGWSDDDWSDEFGIMVPVDNEERLTIALKEMIDKYQSYDGKKIADYCNSHYSEKAIVKQLESVFYKVKRVQI